MVPPPPCRIGPASPSVVSVPPLLWPCRRRVASDSQHWPRNVDAAATAASHRPSQRILCATDPEGFPAPCTDGRSAGPAGQFLVCCYAQEANAARPHIRVTWMQQPQWRAVPIPPHRGNSDPGPSSRLDELEVGCQQDQANYAGACWTGGPGKSRKTRRTELSKSSMKPAEELNVSPPSPRFYSWVSAPVAARHVTTPVMMIRPMRRHNQVPRLPV